MVSDYAFPMTEPPANCTPDEVGPVHRGMTLRDYFAAHALTGLIAYEDHWLSQEDLLPNDAVARGAYRLADAMLKVREEQP